MSAPRPIFVLPRTTRNTLLSLVIIALLPVLCVQGSIFVSWFHAQYKAEVNGNTDFARAVSQAFSAYVRDVQREEHAVGYALITRESYDRRWVNDYLSVCVAQYSTLHHLSWVGTDGTVRASSDPSVIGRTLTQRPYFASLATGDTDLAVSDLFLSPDGDRPAFDIASTVRDARGKVHGIVVAEVNSEKLDDRTLDISRTGQGMFTLVDRTGMVVFSSQKPTISWQERHWHRQYPQIAETREYREFSGVFPWGDQQKRMVVTLVPITSIGWVAAASRPEANILHPLLRKVAWIAALMLLITLGSILLAMRFARVLTSPIHRLQMDAQAFGYGDLDLRTSVTGPVELADLSRTFNEMAEQIQAQQEEVTAQNEELQAQQEELSAQNEELQAQQEELTAQAEELQAHQDDLAEKNVDLEKLAGVLETERAFLSTAIEILPLPMLFISPSCEVLLANDACWQLLGGCDVQTWWSQRKLLSPETRLPIADKQQPFTRALHGEVTASLEALALLPDGREHPVLIQAAPVVVGEKAAAVVEIFQDITELKEEDRAKNEFLAVLSHELLTPVTSMLGWAQVAQEPTAGSDVVEQALAVIERNARRQKRLVDDLLDVSRIIHGKLALIPESVDLNSLVEQQVENVQQTVVSCGVRLVHDVAHEPLLISVDPARTTQVIANLINNAIKFTPNGGTITLRCARVGGKAVLMVQDTGKGIAPEYLPNVFDPFHQLHRDEAKGGLGLGLALVKGIVELQSGRATASSPGVGQGSTFTIEFPLIIE